MFRPTHFFPLPKLRKTTTTNGADLKQSINQSINQWLYSKSRPHPNQELFVCVRFTLWRNDQLKRIQLRSSPWLREESQRFCESWKAVDLILSLVNLHFSKLDLPDTTTKNVWFSFKNITGYQKTMF